MKNPLLTLPIKNRTIWFLSGSILLLLFIYIECFVKADKDFDIFIGASKLIREGKSCYNVWIPTGKNTLLYYYSPLFAVLLTPLSYLPQYLYNIVWASCNIFLLYRIILLIDYYTGVSGFSNRNKIFFILIVIACTLRFLLYNFDLGQMTIFLVYASLESIRLIHENKKWHGAGLLAFAINIKLLPLTLLFYLIYRGEYKAFVLVIFFSVTYLILPSIFIGVSFNNILLNDWWNIMATTIDKSIIDDVGRESLSALVPAFFMEIKEEITFRRNLMLLSAEATVTILNAIKILLILFTIYFLRTLPFKKINDRLHHFYALSYIMLITPLIAPHQGKYAFFYMLPAFSYLIYRGVCVSYNKKESIDNEVLPSLRLSYKFKIALVGIIISFIFTTITTDGIIGRHYSNIANYYHLITIGALILIIPMTLLKPDKKLIL